LARAREGPLIQRLNVPAADERRPVEVDFTFDGRGRQVVALDVFLATPLGVVRQQIPAAAVGIESVRGAGRLTLDLSALPAGAHELTLALVGEGERRGPPASASFEVAGMGGAGPTLVGVRPASERITRPRGDDDIALARFALEGASGEGQLTAVWIRLRTPAGAESVTAVAPPDREEREVTLAAFRSGDELGEYAAGVTLLDAAGNLSETLEAAVELVPEGGATGPSIDGFTPKAARAGDEVVVHGQGLGAEGIEVEIAGVPVGVLAAEGDALRIRMPDVDRPGLVSVVSRAGAGLSADTLTPRVGVHVFPEELLVPEGVPTALTALVTGTTDGSVEWRAEARDGEPGTISPEGVYTPPLGREKGSITITAVSTADPSASGRAKLRVVAHPPARGPLPLGPLGGTVLSQDDRCALTLPRDAIRELTTIGVETTQFDPEESAPEGQLIVGGAQISGAPGQLGAPGELVVPLRFPLEPGAKVKIQVADDPSGPWNDFPDFGIVIPGEELLKIQLESVQPHVRGTIDYTPGPPSFLPSIQGIGPTALHEGQTAAVHVTGTNFVPGVTSVTVRRSTGAIEPLVEVRTVYVTADGKNLGVTLKAHVMPDLYEGDTRQLRLRVTTPAGYAERTLEIIGHDEIDFSGGLRAQGTSATFSSIRVGPGATLRLAHSASPVRIAAYETIVVGGYPGQGRGLVDVTTGGAGANGTQGDAPAGGGAGGAGGPAAAGGPGVPGSGGSGGAGGFGATGNGTPGTPGGAAPGSLPGAAGGGGFGAFGSGGDGASGSAAPGPPLPVTVFLPRLLLGAGGGGGGGGGGEGIVFKTTAGGGGGGGAGGGALELAAGEEIRIRGRVAANGGNGGDGAFPFTVGTPPSAPLFHAGCGGGGGAGGGGAVFLRGLRLLEGEVLAVGGTNGRAARFAGAVITVSGTLTELQRLLANPQSGQIYIDGSVPSAATIAPTAFLAPDLDYRPNLVADAPQIVVSGYGSDSVRVRNSAGEQFVPASGAPFTVTVPLAPGFNDLDAVVTFVNVPGDPPIVLAASHPVRIRKVLYLPGVAPVFAFTCTIAPATPTVVTERTVKLTATVTGTTLVAVTWSVDGGAANGAADQQGSYKAPCAAPNNPVTVRASSVYDPSKSGTATVTVIPGIEVDAQAAVGTPADPALPSANIGQAITIRIPAAARALTGEDFAAGQTTAFQTIERDAAGTCKAGATTVAGTVAAGMTSLQVAVPACTAPDEQVRIPGHGCARLQVVPRISALDRSPSLGQGMAVSGDGFACGATDVYFGATKVPAAQVLSVSCTVILLGTRPAAGEQVTVRTAGGTSNAVT
jgi:hypothetical protein